MFICHGNICRSPMAEFIFRDMAEKAKIADMQEAKLLKITLDYEWYSILLKLLSEKGVMIKDTCFDNAVSVTFAVKNDLVETFIKRLTDTFNGKVSAVEIDSGFYNFN